MTLGEKIRVLRTARRMSLSDMAALTGITKSMLSQVENNLSSPSITTLRRIGAALGVPMTAFFEEGVFEGQVSHKATRKKLILAGSSVVYELLSPGSRMVEFMSAILPEGAATSDEPMPHGGEECILVLEGRVVLTLGGETIELAEGDSIGFDGSVPHRISNDRPETATLIMAICPPLF